MDRRRVLLVAAAVVAALGTVLVFLYVRGADNRAEERFETTEVLVATAQIERGERIADAAAAGKLALQAVPRGQVLPGALVTTGDVAEQIALTVIYPGEQVVPQKLGDTAVEETRLNIPEEGDMAMSINLTDPARVAGFVNPGSEVAIFLTGSNPTTGAPFSSVLLTRVTVIAVGSTTPVTTTTTTTEGQGQEGGQQVVESLPRTLITLSVSQAQMQRVLLAQQQGELSFALLTEDSKVTLAPATTVDNLLQN
ncbi:Flp pilus assembly protein CpaB [Nocardioides sp.]|uniref:Flp pilus assembly protein CpaB n=1 Tax=Nocardioides sp. TaxID=35761 RepID=UPI0026147CB9|nr:Flp pilus assembly protein CpaB [Nocardioides sp.]